MLDVDGKYMSVVYEITKDRDGLWCIKGKLPSGIETATIYAKDTTALFNIFVMLDGSAPIFCSPANDSDLKVG